MFAPTAPVDEPVVTPQDVEAAVDRIAPYIRRTPTLRTRTGELGVDHDLTLKLECLQHTGSFKPRGAFNKVLSSEVGPAGLIAASGGNHGVAVAFVASVLGHDAEIFVPSISPAIKQRRIAGYGATVRIAGAVYSEAQRACDERSTETGALLVHPYDAVETVAGQATCGRELQEQAPELDTILVAVGGGGLAAGIAAAYRDTARIVTVEPATSRCFAAALDAGSPVAVDVAGIAADSLGANVVGGVPWNLLSRFVDDAITVTDDAIATARQRAWDELQVVLEPGGAAALAAVTSGAYRPRPGETVGVILCGANTDPGNLVPNS